MLLLKEMFQKSRGLSGPNNCSVRKYRSHIFGWVDCGNLAKNGVCASCETKIDLQEGLCLRRLQPGKKQQPVPDVESQASMNEPIPSAVEEACTLSAA